MIIQIAVGIVLGGVLLILLALLFVGLVRLFVAWIVEMQDDVERWRATPEHKRQAAQARMALAAEDEKRILAHHLARIEQIGLIPAALEKMWKGSSYGY